MEAPLAVDLRGRKHVCLRWRQDLAFTSQKFEGRTWYIVKDPLTLHYWQFNEHERFILALLDGEHTLDEAQKAFEKRFPPERLSLEEIEAFATDLLQAGLVHNESPQVGRLLLERARKRRRAERLARLGNLFFIRIPLVAPDRFLTRLLPPLRFVFTFWFLVLSLGLVLAAVTMVGIHWNEFVAKLPSATEFFSVTTLLYLWLTLGLVKVLHELGHGLSCKAFGGEVDEMGVLFLLFSPCLYCGVSDAWTLPSKWQRIAISAAGIYVELIIASVATFLWWATDEGTFWHHLCLSMMVICSVNTVFFNANPLMRFDGYYVLSDWLEVPNLWQRSQRCLQELLLRHVLGMEVPAEEVARGGRRWWLLAYAAAGFVYRWIVTLAIVYAVHRFLQPHKLGVVAWFLGAGILATMLVRPVQRVIQVVRQQGRLPAVKGLRIGVLAAGLAVLLAALWVVPLPVRVEGLALIQVEPNQVQTLVAPESGGFLQEVLVRNGQHVRAGDVVAVLSNPQLELSLRINEADQALRRQQQRSLMIEFIGAGPRGERAGSAFQEADFERQLLAAEHAKLSEQRERLTLRAARDGIVLGLCPREDQGKWLEAGTELCRVGNAQALRAVLLVDPRDRSLLAPGSKAQIRIHGRGSHGWPGVVSDIARVEAKDIPLPLSNRAGGEIPTQQDPVSRVEKPQTQHYLVAVRFLQRDDAIQPGVLGRVKIDAPPQSIGQRLRRYLAANFR